MNTTAGWENREQSEKLILEFSGSPYTIDGEGYTWAEWITICKVFGVNPNTTHIIELKAPYSTRIFTDEQYTNEK